MKTRSKYIYFFFQKLGIFSILCIILYFFKIQYVVYFWLFYVTFQTFRYYFEDTDFIIDEEGILVGNEKYNFSEISKIQFIESRFMLFEFTNKVKILFVNGKIKIIKCSGIFSANDEFDNPYEYSLYATYEFTKSKFENTYYCEHYLFGKYDDI